MTSFVVLVLAMGYLVLALSIDLEEALYEDDEDDWSLIEETK